MTAPIGAAAATTTPTPSARDVTLAAVHSSRPCGCHQPRKSTPYAPSGCHAPSAVAAAARTAPTPPTHQVTANALTEPRTSRLDTPKITTATAIAGNST